MVGTEDAHTGHGIFSLGTGLVAFDAAVQIPSGRSRVSVMEATNLRNLKDATFGWKLDFSWNRRIAIQRKMCSTGIN